MAINEAQARQLAIQGRVLKPRMQVFVGPGEPMKPGPVPNIQVSFPLSANCIISQHNVADRFKIVCSVTADPGQTYDFWAGFDSIDILLKIYFLDYPGFSTPIQIFRGSCDKIDFDSHKGEVTLTGRNYIGKVIDSQKPVNPINTEIAAIVEEIAGHHDLKVDYGGVPPEGGFGTLIQEDKGLVNLGFQSRNLTEMDTLQQLAAISGRAIFEKDGVLFFVPPDNLEIWTCVAPTPAFQDAGRRAGGAGGVTTLFPSNSISLKFTHDFRFTQGTQVVGIHHKRHVPETVVVKHPEDNRFANPDNIQQYFLEMNSMSDEDADRMIKNYHDVINYREWLMEWKVAGPEYLTMGLRDLVVVTGTNSFVDGDFGIASIEYDIDFKRGFTQIIKGVWGRTEGEGS